MTPELVTKPTADVVSVRDLREYLRVDGNDEDFLIQTLRDAAVSYLDGWGGVLGRAIMPQTWREEYETGGDLRLSLPDVSSVTVTVRDAAGAWQAGVGTLSRDGLGWVVTVDTSASVRVDYVCALPDTLRPSVVMAIKMLVAHWFDNRGLAGASLSEWPMAVDALLAPLRRDRI